jgi:signal transduction histidine kinase
MTGVTERVGSRTIRTRILMIAWVPSLALLLVGGIFVGFLGFQAAKAVSNSSEIKGSASGGGAFITLMQKEMNASAAVIADPSLSKADLTAKQNQLNQVFQTTRTMAARMHSNGSAKYQQADTGINTALGGLPAMRKRVAAGSASVSDVQHYYGGVLDLIAAAASDLGRRAGTPSAAVEFTVGSRLIGASVEMSQGNALAYAAFSSTGMTEPEYQDFVRQAGVYRTQLAAISGSLNAAEQKTYRDIIASKPWREQLSVEQAVLNSTPPTAATTGGNATGKSGDQAGGAAAPAKLRRAELPISRAEWLAANNQLTDALTGLALSQNSYSASLAATSASRQRDQAVLAGVLLILFAILVLVLTTRESNKLIGRLRRLRQETLEMAQTQLPRMVARLRGGETVEAADEIPGLDLGSDEIGQVADAFNFAQRVAIAAAVQEAETRAGLRAVFLNIAYRSQVIVHRQLNVLERAERFQEDPEQLQLLFELDHLATRARRNAENLVILGGGQPGRRWRNSVSLLQIVRGAISEAQDYARVSIAQLPGVAIHGTAVADVIHLLAELVDNATSFSPPMSRVEVRGNMVGRGVVLEVEDQGLGIPLEQLDQLNQMLKDPPDFHAITLREEPRLGMFVVAQLARSQGIRVTLTPSPAYGGTRAVVLLPNELIDVSAEYSALPGEVIEAEQEPPALTTSAPSDGRQMAGRSLHERMAFNRESGPQPTEAYGASPARNPEPDNRPRMVRPVSSARLEDTQGSPRTLPPGLPLGVGKRPELPRRNRQAHHDERLRSGPGRTTQLEAAEPAATDPDQARRRMAAFQRGTRQGRSERPDA